MRQAYAQETRERILVAVAELMRQAPDGAISFDELARVAGVERRTVFRHFANKDDLLDAFWVWLNAQVVGKTLPERYADLLQLPVEAFAGFDRQEGIIRASLHTPSGREMRLRTLEERRHAFSAALAPMLAGADREDAQRLEQVVHALFSAATWETLKDYCGLSGDEAGRTVTWAIQALTETVQKRAAGQDGRASAPPLQSQLDEN
ncbi:MAG: hypothetical protein Devi2KO_10940 [Devosia indica]